MTIEQITAMAIQAATQAVQAALDANSQVSSVAQEAVQAGMSTPASPPVTESSPAVVQHPRDKPNNVPATDRVYTLVVTDITTGAVVFDDIFSPVKQSASGKPNRHCGGKIFDANGDRWQLGCNMTKIG
jgi:hypothetical protein